VVIATHCNLRPPDVVPVVMGFNYKARNASAYKFNNPATSAHPYYTYLPNLYKIGQYEAEFLMILHSTDKQVLARRPSSHNNSV